MAEREMQVPAEAGLQHDLASAGCSLHLLGCLLVQLSDILQITQFSPFTFCRQSFLRYNRKNPQVRCNLTR
jgi:hypothetical protein